MKTHRTQTQISAKIRALVGGWVYDAARSKGSEHDEAQIEVERYANKMAARVLGTRNIERLLSRWAWPEDDIADLVDWLKGGRK